MKFLMKILLRFLPCALDETKMNRIHGGTNAVWLYASADNNATTKGANYYNSFADRLIVGDIIVFSSSDSPDVLQVTSNDGTTVVTTELNVV